MPARRGKRRHGAVAESVVDLQLARAPHTMLDRIDDSPRRRMKVAAYQAPLLPGGSIEAIELIAAQVKACEAVGVEILCCPEAVLGGLADHSRCPAELAIDAATGQLRTVLAPMASETVTTIVGFTEHGPEGRLFNSAAVFSQGEVVGVYRKRHPAINRSVYEPGTATPIFKIGDLVFGVVICRDSTFSGLVRSMAFRGATALFVPTNNALLPTKGGAEVAEHARQTDISRARENRISVVRADVAGRAGGLESYGSSAIVDPDGSTLLAARQMEPDLLVAEIQTAVPAARLPNHALHPTAAVSRAMNGRG
jgi:5-aminopentanamidase